MEQPYRRCLGALVTTLLAFWCAQSSAQSTTDPDVTNDGIVNVLDLSFVGQCFASSVRDRPECEPADTDYSGRIDSIDFNHVFNHLGETGYAFSSDPEERNIIRGQGAPFVVNEIVIKVPEGTTRPDVEDIIAPYDGSVVGHAPRSNRYTIRFPISTVQELDETLSSIRSDTRVEGASVSVFLSPDQAPPDRLPNDIGRNPLTDRTWGFDKIDAPAAWDLLTQLDSSLLASINFGVHDTGIDENHYEFQGVPISGRRFSKTDARNHGTGVAALIGAENDLQGPGSLGLNGMLSGAALSSSGGSKLLYFLHSAQLGATEGLDAALQEFEWANVGVVNISNGVNRRSALPPAFQATYGVDDALFPDVVDKIVDAFAGYPNILIVLSAGNFDLQLTDRSAGYIKSSNVIVVGGTTDTDTRWSGSAWGMGIQPGKGVDIAAPSEDVWSAAAGYTEPRNDDDYRIASGTSFAAPFVAGTAGLMRSIAPNIHAQDIRLMLVDTGDPITTDKFVGDRRLNASKAVACALVRRGMALDPHRPEESDLAPRLWENLRDVAGIRTCLPPLRAIVDLGTVAALAVVELSPKGLPGQPQPPTVSLVRRIDGEAVFVSGQRDERELRSLAIDKDGRLRTGVALREPIRNGPLFAGTQTIDLLDGSVADAVFVGAAHGGFFDEKTWGLATDLDGIHYLVTTRFSRPTGNPFESFLLRIDETTPSAQFRGIFPGSTVTALEFSPNGTLYAWSSSFGLATMNKDDGAFTLTDVAGDNGRAPNEPRHMESLAFTATGRLIGVASSSNGGSDFFELDPQTGAATSLGTTPFNVVGLVGHVPGSAPAGVLESSVDGESDAGNRELAANDSLARTANKNTRIVGRARAQDKCSQPTYARGRVAVCSRRIGVRFR